MKTSDKFVGPHAFPDTWWRDDEEKNASIIPGPREYWSHTCNQVYPRESFFVECNQDVEKCVLENPDIEGLYHTFGYLPIEFRFVQNRILRLQSCFSPGSLARASPQENSTDAPCPPDRGTSTKATLIDKDAFLSLLSHGTPEHLASKALWDASLRTASRIREDLQSGHSSVDVEDLKTFVIQRLGSVEAQNLPEEAQAKKRKLDSFYTALLKNFLNDATISDTIEKLSTCWKHCRMTI